MALSLSGFVAAVAFSLMVSAWSYRTLFTPIGLHTASFVLALLTLAGLKMAGGEWQVEAARDLPRLLTMCALAITGFTLPWIRTRRAQFFVEVDSRVAFVLDVRNIRMLLLAEALALLLVVLVGNVLLGFPLISMLRGSMDIDAMHAAVTQLPLGLLGLNLWLEILLICHLASFIAYPKAYGLGAARLTLLVGAVVLGAIWQAKRQVLLVLLLLISFVLWADKGKRKHRVRVVLSIASGAATFWFIYLAVQYFRVGSGRLFYAELPLSVVWPVLNFDRAMAAVQPSGQFGFLLSELVPNRFLGHGTGQLWGVLFEPTASRTYLQAAYLDFGWIGVAAVPFLVALILRWLSAAYADRVTGLHLRLVVLWLSASGAFYSHLISLNYFLVPSFLLLAMPLLFGRMLRRGQRLDRQRAGSWRTFDQAERNMRLRLADRRD
jgi:hypothetical protein